MTRGWTLDHVSVAFGDRVALDSVTSHASPGEVVALIGPSGSGKSTLLRVLAASQPLCRGDATVLGVSTANLWGRRLRALRRDVGIVLQHHNLVDGLRVFHNVAMGCLGRWSTARALSTLVWPRRRDIATVEAALGQVELPGRAWDWPRELSGGERQRVALARLLVQSPKLWLADEPSAGLDPRLRTTLLRQTLGLVRDRGAGAVVSLHDTELLGCGFDRVIGLRAGAVEFDLPTEQAGAVRVRALYARR